MTDRKSPPTIGAIMDYWTGRCLPFTNQYVPFYSSDEAKCFACGWWDARGSGHNGERGARGLERAHCVPHSSGGSNDASNYALLCKMCHLEAPNTLDEEWFWKWIENRPSSTPIHRIMDRAIAALQLIPIDRRESALQFMSVPHAGKRMAKEALTLQAVTHWGEGVHNPATLARAWIAALDAYENEQSDPDRVE